MIFPDRTDGKVIIFGGLQGFTRPFAVPEVIFKAHPEFLCPDILFGQVQVAGTERKQLPDKVHECMHQPDIGIRTEIKGAVADHMTGGEHPRERLIFYAYPGKGLVILQRNIIMWAGIS